MKNEDPSSKNGKRVGLFIVVGQRYSCHSIARREEKKADSLKVACVMIG